MIILTCESCSFCEEMKGLIEMAKEIGQPLAIDLSRIAQGWGNIRAEGWVADEFYAIHLGLSALNGPIGLCV